jgi:hypothetical protein
MAEIDEVIAGSAAVISEILGRSASSIAFAYPSGAVTAYAARVVAQTFRAGFTSHSRPVTALDRVSTLPRINIDASVMRNVEAGNSASHLLAVARERAKLHARTGVAWRVLGPMGNALRMLAGTR